MAVYTKLTIEDLAPILEQYDIGEPLGLTPIAEGTANTNYLFATTTGRYVCTLFELPEEAAQMSWLPQYLEHLTHKGQNVVSFVADKTGNHTQYLNKKVFVISYYLRGTHAKPTAKEAEQAGAAMAQIHQASDGYTAPVAQPWAPKAMKEFVKDITQKQHPLYKALMAEPTWQVSNEQARLGLPQGVVHADYFPDNVLFEGGYLSGVIDFNVAGIDAFAYDLAMALTAWGFDDAGTFKPALFKALYKGYTDVRPLSAKEVAAMPELCQRACCVILAMRLLSLDRPQDAGEGPRPPEAYGKRLEFFKDEANLKDLFY